MTISQHAVYKNKKIKSVVCNHTSGPCGPTCFFFFSFSFHFNLFVLSQRSSRWLVHFSSHSHNFIRMARASPRDRRSLTGVSFAVCNRQWDPGSIKEGGPHPSNSDADPRNKQENDVMRLCSQQNGSPSTPRSLNSPKHRTHMFLHWDCTFLSSCICMLVSAEVNISILNALSEEPNWNIISFLNIGIELSTQSYNK